MELAMKKVLVTGGTRGIGRALAEALVREGAEVMICGRSRDAVAAAQAELGVRGIACDVTCEADRQRLVCAVRGELSGLDVLINNAGVQRERDLTQRLDLTSARDELDLNLVAPIALTGALLPSLMSSQTPVVVNVTSALSIAPAARAPVYAASKAGLASFTRCLRAQLAETGVRVVEVVPPLVATGMTAGRQDGAISAERTAELITRGLKKSGDRLLVGKARALALLHRVWPTMAEQTMLNR